MHPGHKDRFNNHAAGAARFPTACHAGARSSIETVTSTRITCVALKPPQRMAGNCTEHSNGAACLISFRLTALLLLWHRATITTNSCVAVERRASTVLTLLLLHSLLPCALADSAGALLDPAAIQGVVMVQGLGFEIGA